VRAGGDPLGLPPPEAKGRWQRAQVVGAIYLADTAATAWAAFHRALAEPGLPPDHLLPRDLWRYELALQRVVDLGYPEKLTAAGLPTALQQSSQWPMYQAIGGRLAATGAEGVLSGSAAGPGHRCVCVFAAALDRLTPIGRERIELAPPPPRGMRT